MLHDENKSFKMFILDTSTIMFDNITALIFLVIFLIISIASFQELDSIDIFEELEYISNMKAASLNILMNPHRVKDNKIID